MAHFSHWGMSMTIDGAGSAAVGPDSWVLQTEAASIAGCSVSVIRKWRRAGAIGERTRTSSGGMKRIEVRLGDVLDKMQDSMPGRAAQALRLASTTPVAPVPPAEPPSIPPAPAERPLGPAGVEVFVQHIVAAERRAAAVEAQLRANEVMIELLRERLAALQAERAASGNGSSGDALARLAAEVRAFRARVEEAERTGARHDAQHRVSVRQTYDAALLCLCTAAGVGTRYKLGSSLPGAERTRLAEALAQVGIDVRG